MPQERRLKDPSLLIGKNYVDGQWVESVSRKRFKVHGIVSAQYFDITGTVNHMLPWF